MIDTRLFRLALICLALSLAGCAGPPPPTYGDAFKGLYNGNSASVPEDVPVTVQPPVGIIFNDNVEAYYQFIKTSKEYWAGVVPASLTNSVAIADSDPTFLNGRVLETLKRHFPNSEVVKDFPQAVRSGKKAVCVVDVVPRLMEPYGDRTTKFDITFYFFDAKMNPVSRMSGHGEEYRPFGAADAGVQFSVDAALQQLDAKLTTLAH